MRTNNDMTLVTTYEILINLVLVYCVANITRDEYELAMINYSTDSLRLHWSLKSQKINEMLKSSFIRGFNYTIYQLSGGQSVTHFANSIDETFDNMTFIVSEWYLVIGQIITDDDDSWYPEPSYVYFMPQGLCNISII